MKTPHLLFLAAIRFAVCGQGPTAEPPPATLDPLLFKKANLVRAGDIEGQMTASLADKEVRFSWAWTTNGPEPEQYSTQIEPVSFWPTEIRGVGDGKIAVAGKARAVTIIEVWMLDTTVTPPLGIVNQSTGQWSYAELNVPVMSRTVIYAEATNGRNMVYNMFYNPAPPAGVQTSLFVQFWDSREVYRVDDTGAYTKVASPTDASVIFQPALGEYRELRFEGDHPQHGYVYGFTRWPNSGSDLDPLVLLDSDRNGSLDGGLVMDEATWNAQGWNVGYSPIY